MSRIVRDLVAAEAAMLSDAERAVVAQWTPDAARASLGVTGDADPATQEQVSAAMAAAERRAEAIYGRSDAGAA